MAELARLAETAGSVVLDALMQRRSHPDGATYIGSGKVTELKEIVEVTGADTVICDGELTPSQLRNLEERLRVKVVDRTALILDIFAQHARSKEGKAQVELAQLNYLVPRLRGWGAALSRQRGGRVAAGAGIGSRGPGETKLEIDRRRIHKRISQLRAELRRHAAGAGHQAVPASGQRGACGLDRRLHQRGQVVAAEPAHRRRGAGRGRPVRHPGPDHPAVPHHGRPGVHADRHRRLRPAPAAPAGRVVPVDAGGDRRADLLLHVVDGSDEHPEEQVAAVREVLGEIDALSVPEIIVVNKIDAADEMTLTRLRHALPGAVFVSARTGAGNRRAAAGGSRGRCPIRRSRSTC